MSSRGRFPAAVVWVAAGWLAVMSAQAETGYVTDMLQLELYASEDMSGRPIQKLRSGDSFEILERKGRYANVRLPGGQSGWIKSLYMVTEEPARARLNKLENQNADLTARLQSLQAQLADRQSRVAELEGSSSNAAEQRAAVEAELQSLRSRNDALESTLSSYGSSVPLSWLIVISLLALVLGVAAGWYFIDTRSRARHGGYRVY